MTHSVNRGPKLSEVDLAFELLQIQGSPKNYHDLIVEVLSRLDLPIDATQISSVLTQINLDTRFAYAGQGEWSLKAWVPTRSAKKLATITLANKATAHDDEIDKEFSEEVNEDVEEQESDMEDGISEIENSFEQENERREHKWGEP
ncbi:MAG: DNA-directed RNA polymerase subunit delta [Desulfitobacteriaceae bacterium]